MRLHRWEASGHGAVEAAKVAAEARAAAKTSAARTHRHHWAQLALFQLLTNVNAKQ